jgi:hypothetical protein
LTCLRSKTWTAVRVGACCVLASVVVVLNTSARRIS